MTEMPESIFRDAKTIYGSYKENEWKDTIALKFLKEGKPEKMCMWETMFVWNSSRDCRMGKAGENMAEAMCDAINYDMWSKIFDEGTQIECSIGDVVGDRFSNVHKEIDKAVDKIQNPQCGVFPMIVFGPSMKMQALRVSDNIPLHEVRQFNDFDPKDRIVVLAQEGAIQFCYDYPTIDVFLNKSDEWGMSIRMQFRVDIINKSKVIVINPKWK